MPIGCAALLNSRAFREGAARAWKWKFGSEKERMRVSGVKASGPRADPKVEFVARPAVHLVRSESRQRRFRLADHGSQAGERELSDRRAIYYPSRRRLALRICSLWQNAGESKSGPELPLASSDQNGRFPACPPGAASSLAT